MPLYFAYGPNISQDQMKECCPTGKFISTGFLPGYRLDFARYSKRWSAGAADAVPAPEDDVWGVVYSISQHDMDALDALEGCPEAARRFQADIFTEDGKLEAIWVYSAAKRAGFAPPSEDYVEILKRGAEENDFPRDYRDMLNRISTSSRG